MIEKLKSFTKDVYSRDDEDSIFGFFYKNDNGKDELRVNGGDWMNDELADFIDDWCKKNNFHVEYEAEVGNDFFIKQGFQKI